jgi:hypothetical protein
MSTFHSLEILAEFVIGFGAILLIAAVVLLVAFTLKAARL